MLNWEVNFDRDEHFSAAFQHKTCKQLALAVYLRTMVKITGKYEGNLRTHSIHAPSGSELLTDAPVDNHGKGEAFSPTDLLATSLATCIVTTMAIVAERNGIDFTSATYEVIKEMTSAPPRRVAKLTLRIQMPASLSPESRTRLEAVAKSCPVHHSLHPDVVTDVSFEYR